MCKVMKTVVWLGIACGIGAVGCADQKKPGQDQAAAADARLREMEEELAKLQAENAAQQKRLADLEDENGKLKSELLTGAKGKQEPAAPGWKTIPGGEMIALDGKVLFDSGKSKLKPEGIRELDRIAATIKSRHPDYDVYVFGHTDDQPIRHSRWTDNYELSCERALSVVRHLKSKGISPKNLAACGWGEHRPVAANRSAAERAMNRRVEIFVMAPHGTSAPQPQEIQRSNKTP